MTDKGNQNVDKTANTHNDGPAENKAGAPETTNREYTKRESGKQNVPGEPVGNPLEDADSEEVARDENDQRPTEKE